MNIKLESLSKKYHHKYVLNDFTVQIDKPGIYPIVGASGSGKTTLLKVASGLLAPTTGHVFYNDKNIFDLSFDERAELRNHHIGFIFQDHFLEGSFSTLENVLLPLYIQKKLTKNEMIDKAMHALRAVGLEDKKDQLAETLSGGEAQRVAVARALVNNPDIIFADEPTGNLDSKNSEKIISILEEISQEKIVFLVTHNQHIANRYSSIIKIKDGKRIQYDL